MMKSLSLTKASNHYRCGRYELAANEFIETISERINDDGGGERITMAAHVPGGTAILTTDHGIFGALPLLSYEADAALCLFRVAIARQDDEQSIIYDKLSKAREANKAYTRALEGVICSLAVELNYEYHRPSVSVGGGSNICKSNNLHTDRDRVQTSVAVLMAAVSGSWLYLHCTDSERTQDKVHAVRLLEKGIKLAACCFAAYNPKVFVPTFREGIEVIDHATEMLKATTSTSAQDVERMEYARRHIHHALNVVGLLKVVDGQQVRYTDNWINRRGEKRVHENDFQEVATSKRSRYFDKNLSLQDYIAHALRCHLLLQNGPKSVISSLSERRNTSTSYFKKQRDSFLDKALAIEKGGLPGQIAALLQSIDVLTEDCNDEKNMDISLKKLSSLSRSSKDAANLMGFMHAKCGNFNKALTYFHTALGVSTSDSSYRKDSMSEKRTVSNIAQCFAMMGEPATCMEVLLHWISMGQSKDKPSCFIRPASIETTPEEKISHSKDEAEKISVMWRLYYAASLIGDWKTCSNVMNEFKSTISASHKFISIAEAFIQVESREQMTPTLQRNDENIGKSQSK